MKFKLLLIMLLLNVVSFGNNQKANDMASVEVTLHNLSLPYVGAIYELGGNNLPSDSYVFCDGQTLDVSGTDQYDLLKGRIGTKYGGDGINTVGIPLKNKIADPYRNPEDFWKDQGTVGSYQPILLDVANGEFTVTGLDVSQHEYYRMTGFTNQYEFLNKVSLKSSGSNSILLIDPQFLLDNGLSDLSGDESADYSFINIQVQKFEPVLIDLPSKTKYVMAVKGV